jgi:hypothetical protein
MTTETELLERAAASTGLSDFGPSEEFRVGLRVLLAAVDEAGLPTEAVTALEASCVSGLETRLRLVQLRVERPEIAEEPIEGPLAVIDLAIGAAPAGRQRIAAPPRPV